MKTVWTIAEELHALSLPENKTLRDEEYEKQARDEALTEKRDLDILEQAVMAAYSGIIAKCRKSALNLERHIFLHTMDIDLGRCFNPSSSLDEVFEMLLEEKLKKEGFDAQVYDVQFLSHYGISGISYSVRFRYAVSW